MNNTQALYPARQELSYSLEGMEPRDQILFKSLVRLLDHLTAQKWTYRPASADYRVDLLVAAEWHSPTRCELLHYAAQPVLSIGKGAERELHLSWPVQPLRLQAELDRIGSVALKNQRASAPVLSAPSPSPSPVLNESQKLFRLKQWPASSYLAGVGRMRMATLLTGRAMGLPELQQRSALQLSVCSAFVAELLGAQLLVVTAAEPATPASAPVPVIHLPSSTKAFAKPHLFARIRERLGIKSSRST